MVSRDFEPPTQYYDEQLISVDEQIASLIARREQLSHGYPGFPYPSHLEEWAGKFQVALPALQHAFAALHHWHKSPPRRVRPDEFLRLVPIMRSKSQGDLQIIVPYVRQYTNCSVVYMELEGMVIRGPSLFDMNLTIEGYDCVPYSGRGDKHYFESTFIVTPIIPDRDIPQLPMTLAFKSLPMLRHKEEERVPTVIPYTTVTFDPDE